MKKLQLLTQFFMLFSMALTISSVQADDDRYWESDYSRSNSPVDIDVVDDSGRTLNQYAANRHNRGRHTQRTYLEAIKGKRYKLRIRNTSDRRVGVVVAVDGRNILNGKKSYLRNNEKMYVLDPYETAYYKGWRTGKNHVNRFYFTSAGDSYSDAWGDRSAMGVIAVAVYNEKHKRQYKKHNRKHSNRAAPSSRGYLADESTGTGFGREEYSPTVRVGFKAKGKPAYKHFFKYEWRNTLCKHGVIECSYYRNHKKHNRFWPREANNDYAPYPPSHANNRRRGWSDQFTRSWEYDYKRGW